MAEHFDFAAYLTQERGKLSETATSDEKIDRTGGSGNDGGMEARIAKLEADVGHIQRDVAELKGEIKELRREFHGAKIWALLLYIGLAGALLGAIWTGYLRLDDSIRDLSHHLSTASAPPTAAPGGVNP